MNRSIFQMLQTIVFKTLKKLFFLFFAYLSFFYFVNFNIYVSCVNFKNTEIFSRYFLREVVHNNINFKVSNCINDCVAKTGLDLLIDRKINGNLNYNISKYFMNVNDNLISFDKKSPYSHPNLFVGVFNSCFANYQFSHRGGIDNFNLFTKNDLTGLRIYQYLNNTLYFYSDELTQIMLNYDSIDLNNKINNVNGEFLKYEIKNSTNYQNYVNINKDNFDVFIKNSLKI